MANNKPLPPPPIPVSETSPTRAQRSTLLSTDSLLHRSRLIRHIFDDIEDQGIQGKKDGWINVFEEALDELALAIAAGGWMPGLKRGRLAQQTARQARLQLIPGEPETKEDPRVEEGDPIQGPKPNPPPNPLERLRHLTAYKPNGGSSSPIVKEGVPEAPQPVEDQAKALHLLLCVSPHGYRRPIPLEDSGFDVIPANIGCSFKTEEYSLQNDDGSSVLFGLNEWEDVDNIKLVGGTFTLKGVNSTQQHQVLSRVLRLSVYIQISLLLEQSLFKDLHVPLKFPRPKPTPLPTSASAQHVQDDTHAKARNSLLPGGLLGIFSRKSLGRLTRSNSVATNFGREGDRNDETSHQPFLRPSFDPGSVLRRLSIMGSIRQQAPSAKQNDHPFNTALQRVERSGACLSTSAGVVIAPPLLLVHLVEKEKEHPKRRLKGDEKVGLSSILGWDGREARGKGMSGIHGFVRQQEISILYSQHTPPSEDPPENTESTLTRASTLSNLPQSGLKLCGKPHWVTYQFYSRETDQVLGEAIRDFINKGTMPCERSECRWKRDRHELRLIHGGVRVVVRVESGEEVEQADEEIMCWQTCAVCGSATSKSPLSDGAWLFSFGKFLEALIYSPKIPSISPTLCEHTTLPEEPRSRLPETRFNIIQHFSSVRGSVSFSLSSIEDIFELRVPRLQVVKGIDRAPRTATDSSQVSSQSVAAEDEKKTLRREIRLWWEGVSDHIDALEVILADAEERARYKALPRLPSSDDAYDVFEGPVSFAALIPLPLSPPPAPSGASETDYFSRRVSQPSESKTISTLGPDTQAPTPNLATSPGAPSIPPKDDSAAKLVALRHGFQRLEQSLYTQLANTPISQLNDVRRSFQCSARGTQKRLLAWQKKHLGSKASAAGALVSKEPEWWKRGCHAVPGANIIIREDDWGSIIAFTLSTADYHRELANLTPSKPAPLRAIPSETSLATPSTGAPSSFFSVSAPYKFFSSSNQPDPDKDDAAWTEPEAYSAVISRKEHIRDPTSLLSIRDVLRKPLEPSTRTGTLASATGQHQTVTARSRPDVGVTVQPVGGEVVVASGENETVEKLLHDLEQLPAESRASTRPPSVLESESDYSGKLDAHIRRATRGSVVSVSSQQSDVTVGKESLKVIGAKGASQLSVASANIDATPPGVPNKEPPTVPPKDPDTPKAESTLTSTTSFFANTIASSLGTAVRYVMNTNEPSRSTPNLHHGKHHNLLGADSETIDDRPHIKYDWTIGKRLKFSCTVYYAKQFDSLRRRCGIEDEFVKSLSKSTNWAADGGKSKSNFWKTSDERYIIKTLVNAWNVADLQFLIDLAPSYFRYIDSTANKATALAKLLGFYTIEVRNLETGAVQSKIDLLVMENLFYDQQITKTFDLKGIQGRKVKPTNKPGGSTKTLFDGEWLEDQQRTLMLIHPHSKRVLREAIRSDAEFLAKSNIMDYSLLLGIDESKKEISCGLVDTIGTYTFAKTLEYKAKHGLQSGTGKEVTVIPPADYQERFVNALEGYFLACPDKWSKPVDESQIINDPHLLPSVL